MLERLQCEHCGHSFPISENRCPHCALPGLFPNVNQATIEKEQRALDQRYEDAVRDAEHRGCGAQVADFEAKAGESKAVIARSLAETLRLASRDLEVYATYHQLVEIEFRIPEGDKWDVLRNLTDDALFGKYKYEIRFAALSLDGRGLTRYSECIWILRDEMIAHRSSVFEENSVMFMEHHHIQLARADKLPLGYRATWSRRASLCVAKLSSRIENHSSLEDWGDLLLRQGSRPEEDEFVEIHIGGPMTVRAFERVLIEERAARSEDGEALQEKLDRFNVPLEVRSWKH